MIAHDLLLEIETVLGIARESDNLAQRTQVIVEEIKRLQSLFGPFDRPSTLSARDTRAMYNGDLPEYNLLTGSAQRLTGDINVYIFKPDQPDRAQIVVTGDVLDFMYPFKYTCTACGLTRESVEFIDGESHGCGHGGIWVRKE